MADTHQLKPDFVANLAWEEEAHNIHPRSEEHSDRLVSLEDTRRLPWKGALQEEVEDNIRQFGWMALLQVEDSVHQSLRVEEDNAHQPLQTVLLV